MDDPPDSLLCHHFGTYFALSDSGLSLRNTVIHLIHLLFWSIAKVDPRADSITLRVPSKLMAPVALKTMTRVPLLESKGLWRLVAAELVRANIQLQHLPSPV